jgi:hypothetical protein
MNWWRWKCRGCNREFVLKARIIPLLTCIYCLQEGWFDKIKEQETKEK